jgi:hypothetical protein
LYDVLDVVAEESSLHRPAPLPLPDDWPLGMAARHDIGTADPQSYRRAPALADGLRVVRATRLLAERWGAKA